LQDECGGIFQYNQNDNYEIDLNIFMEIIMKRTCIVILILVVSLPTFSQRQMVIHKNTGTKDYYPLSVVDSLTFMDALMVPVAGGTFTAGSTLTTISSFYIDKYEVTYELWTAVKTWGATHGYTDLPTGINGYDPVGTNNPVTEVNWYDVIKWCNARSEKDGLTPVYYTSNTLATVYRTSTLDLLPDCVKWTANGYRLPTEAEWEFAARGGNSTHGYTYSGSSTVGNVAWYYCDNTNTVGQKSANELGIYDMSGNVWEWCWDWYGSAYPSGGTTDPKGPSTTLSYRLLRGGSWFGLEGQCRVDYRFDAYPTLRPNYNGFRCVQD
jgi:formylglycine-generating enzyme required for sulfatase activity